MKLCGLPIAPPERPPEMGYLEARAAGRAARERGELVNPYARWQYTHTDPATGLHQTWAFFSVEQAGFQEGLGAP